MITMNAIEKVKKINNYLSKIDWVEVCFSDIKPGFLKLICSSAYLRVMNSSGNYLRASGNVISDVNRQVFRELTHFYF